jgi:hypothetical protein
MLSHFSIDWGKRMVRRVRGPKREEVTGDWRRLHNNVINNFYNYLSPIILKWIKWRNELDEACSKDIMDEGFVKSLGIKHEGKRPLGRRRCRWENNIWNRSEYGVRMGTWFLCFRTGPVPLSCEHSVKIQNFQNDMNNKIIIYPF